MNVILVVVEGFNNVVGHIVGALGMEGVVEFDETTINQPLALKTFGEL